MRRIVISEAQLRKREEIKAQRNRYYAAKAQGLSREQASAIANGAARQEAVAQPGAEPDLIPIPDDWASLSYLPRTKGGPSLRGIASKLGQPVNNMADAVAAIEAELQRRMIDAR